MTEKQLIAKIKELRQIKPRKDWVFLTKTRVLGVESKPSFSWFRILSYKPAFAGILTALVVFSMFSYSFVENSLPGDLLYIVRRVAHKGLAIVLPMEEKPVYQLKLANERLEDLTKATGKNLAPTINEFQNSVSEAAKDIAKLDATTSSPIVIKRIAEEAKKLETNRQKVESLGVVIGEETTIELNDALANVVGGLIEDLEARSLTVEQEQLLDEIGLLYGEGKYTEALELYLVNQ